MMLEKSYIRIPQVLREHGISVRRREFSRFKLRFNVFWIEMFCCERDGVSVNVGVGKLAKWVGEQHDRHDKVMVAAIRSLDLRFWRMSAQRRLEAEVLELLTQFAVDPR
jgi:hypothetical protein